MIGKIKSWVVSAIQDTRDDYRCWVIDGKQEAVLGMKNPSTRVLKHAIKYDVKLMGEIQNPSDELKKFAVEHHSNALDYISEQTDDLIIRAVSINPYSIKYAINPSYQAMKIAIKKLPEAIQFLPNAPDQIQLIAITADPYLISHLAKPDLATQLVAVSKSPNTVLLIKNLKLGAVKRSLETLRGMKDIKLRDRFTIKGLHLTTDQWWVLVKEFPEFYEMMSLNEEQKSYAIICA